MGSDHPNNTLVNESSGLRRRLSYGWIIVAASFLITFCTYAVQFSFGVFLKPLEQEFEWSRAMTSWAPSLFMLSLFGFNLFAGWFSDRYGPKRIVGLGVFLVGLGLVLTSQVSAPWQLYLYYSFIVGMGTGFTAAPIFATVSRWFLERRGLALGIAASATGIGTLAIPPLARYLISTYGWQTSYLIMGFGVWVVIIAALLLEKEPAHMKPLSMGANSQTKHGLPKSEDFTVKQAVRTRTLWLLILLFTLVFAGTMMVMYHLVAYAQDAGIPEMTAAALLTTIGGTSIFGRISAGMVSDRFGRKPVLILCLALQALMTLWLVRSTSIGMLYLFAGIWGFGYGGRVPLTPAIVGELFGLHRMGSILAIAGLGSGAGGLIGPAVAGYLFDATGGYSAAFSVGAAAMFLSAIIVLFLRKPRID